MQALVAGQKRQRAAENAARQAEEDAEAARTEEAEAHEALTKAYQHADSKVAARKNAVENAQKLRAAADRLAPPEYE